MLRKLKNIEDLRRSYEAPEQSQLIPESIVNDKWVSDMSNEVNAMTGLEFDLGGDKTLLLD